MQFIFKKCVNFHIVKHMTALAVMLPCDTREVAGQVFPPVRVIILNLSTLLASVSTFM